MKTLISKIYIVFFLATLSFTANAQQDFQGKAYYFSKTTMDLSRFGGGDRQFSEAEKKQMMARMKPWLEKTYILTFNKEESIFLEDEKLEGPGGRGPSVWGSSFSAGPQYKNVKTKTFLQDQEFFGKQFLITETMEPIPWVMGTESKQIGQYTCFKATASIPSKDINWTRTMQRDEDKEKKKKEEETKKEDAENVDAKTDVASANNEENTDEAPEMLEVIAWYTPMIPVSQGPGEYWGLPGLIMEVSAGNNVMLCSKIVMNPEEKTKIEAPSKGDVVTKKEYNEIITTKMQEFRDNRGRGSGGRGGRGQ